MVPTTHLRGDAREGLAALADGAYGSDNTTGLVWAYEFAPGRAPRAITSAEAADRVRDGGHACRLWLHFSLANSKSEPWLRDHLQLPNAFYESLCDAPSTRVEAIDDSLVAVMRDVPFFGAVSDTNLSVTLCVDARMMVSARTKQLRSVDRLRAAVKAGAVFESPVELLAHLLRDQADVLMDIVREATTEVDGIEDHLMETRSSSGERSALGVIRRRLVRLQRLLAPEPAALFRLLNRPPAWLRDSDIAELRRSAEELSTAVADSSAVIERIRILQDELSANLDEATNRTLYILTILTAIVAPFEFISQLFGMSVGGVPFRDNPYGFLIVFLVIVAVIGLGAALVRRLLRS